MKQFLFFLFVSLFIFGFCGQTSAQTKGVSESYGAATIQGKNYPKPTSSAPAQKGTEYYTPKHRENAPKIAAYATSNQFNSMTLDFDSWVYMMTTGRIWRWVWLPKGSQFWGKNDELYFLKECGNPVTGLSVPEEKVVKPQPCQPGAWKLVRTDTKSETLNGVTTVTITQVYNDNCEDHVVVSTNTEKIIQIPPPPCEDCEVFTQKYGVELFGGTSAKQRFAGGFTTKRGIFKTLVNFGLALGVNAATGVRGTDLFRNAGISAGGQYVGDAVNPSEDILVIQTNEDVYQVKRGKDRNLPEIKGRITWNGGVATLSFQKRDGTWVRCESYSLKETTNFYTYNERVVGSRSGVIPIKPVPVGPGGQPQTPRRPSF